MSMEPFDYLTYKRSKILKANNEKLENKRKILFICAVFVLFLVGFLLAIGFVARKATKLDFEYGKFGKDTINKEENLLVDNDAQKEKYSIDKRLFLLKDEEYRPSKSKVVDSVKEQNEVISKEQFDELKTNNESIKNVTAGEKKTAFEPPVAPKESAKKESLESEKPVILPKIPIKPKVTTSGSFESQSNFSKVLIGKYQTASEARASLERLQNMPSGVIPFVKKINDYYTLQVGSFESFATAKNVAGQLKANGYDVWIMQ